MAPAKRKNAAAAGASKKAKNSEWADISKEINHAELAPEVRDMLLNVLPLSLGEYADHRHKYQQQMVSALEAVLRDVEGSKVNEVTRLKTELETTNKDKAEKEAATSEANQQKESKGKTVQDRKVALASAAVAFREAREKKENAVFAKQADDKDFQAAKKKKDTYVGMMEDLDFLRTAVPEEPETEAKGTSLIASMKKWNFEESLQIALPSVFLKQPDARGQFDVIALEGLAKALRNRIEEQEGIITAAEPKQQKHDSDIAASQDSLKSAIAEQVSAAKAYEEASDALQTCEKEATSAQKAARDATNLIKKLSSKLNNAEAELDIFRDGPFANFQRLQQRTEPVAEEPATATEEPVEKEAVSNEQEEQTKVAEEVAVLS